MQTVFIIYAYYQDLVIDVRYEPDIGDNATRWNHKKHSTGYIFVCILDLWKLFGFTAQIFLNISTRKKSLKGLLNEGDILQIFAFPFIFLARFHSGNVVVLHLAENKIHNLKTSNCWYDRLLQSQGQYVYIRDTVYGGFLGVA